MQHRAFDNADDIELIKRIAARDNQALAELYERHASGLLAIALCIVKDRCEAEDLVHDVLLEAWRAAASYDASRGRVWTWLAVRMRSRCIDRIRTNRPRTPGDVETLVSSADDEESSPDHARVRTALENVSPLRRRVLELMYFCGLSHREVAHKLSIPIGTVKSRYAGAIRELRLLFATQSITTSYAA
jgi:RNA polymerase sigma-70 factor (ECF subfamily)